MRITVDLSWQENTESDLAGYKITWGDGKTAERAVMVRKELTSIQISAVVKRKAMTTFSVQAFDIAGNESDKRIVKRAYVE